MVKGLNYIQLNAETVQLYITEALNSRLGPGVNVKVTGVANISNGGTEDVALLEFAFKEQR